MKLPKPHYRAITACSILVISLSASLPLTTPAKILRGAGSPPPAAVSQHPDTPVPRPDSAADYKSILPQVSAPQLKKLQSDLDKLKSFSEELQAKLNRAPKQAGFDLKLMEEEFRKVLQEPNSDKRNQQIEEFHQRYEQTFAKHAAAAGIDLAAERDRFASLLGLSATELAPGFAADSRNLGIARVPPPPMSVAAERPPATVQTALSDYFTPPYSGGGTRGTDGIFARALSLPREGYLELNTTTLVIGGTQTIAFLTQGVPLRAGASYLRVEVEVDELSFYAAVSSVLGSASAEAFVTLRVLDGSRVITSDRHSLGRAAVPLFGSARSYASGRSLLLRCDSDRPPANLKMVVELEGAVGVFGLGTTTVTMTARPRRFTVTMS